MTSILMLLALACSKQENTTNSFSTPIRPKNPGEITQLTDSETVVANWTGGSMKYGGFSESNNSQLKQMEAKYLTERYDYERGALIESVMTKVLEEEAKKSGHATIDALLSANVDTPSDEEVKAFFEKALAENPRLQGTDLATVKPQIVDLLQEEQKAKFVSEIKEKYKVEINLPFPDVPRLDVSLDDDPVLGNKDAPVTIVQFAEYECHFCGKASEVIDKIMKEYDGKIKMVFRDFPLGFHERAIPAAVAANCAGDQGKYWEMHKKLMADQRALDDATLVAHATDLELDLTTWEKCRLDPTQVQEVNKDFSDGSKLGVSGTPAFFVNGLFFSGALPYEQFKEIIDRELNLNKAK